MTPVVLPNAPVEAIKDLSAYKFLLMSDPGMGKTGFLASIPDYLLIDPEAGAKGYTSLRVELTSWEDHLDLRDKLAKATGAYAGIGLDSLNVSYDHCSRWVMKLMKLRHPGEAAQGQGWQRVTAEFIAWLRDMTLLGFPVVATCHTTIMEVRVRSIQYHRWIPAFAGGGPTSTYSHILKIFDIIGFLTMEDVLEPPTTKKLGTTQVDVRADVSDVISEEKRIICFKSSNYWLAEDTSQMLPEKIYLTNNYRDDWRLVQEAWGQGPGHEIVAEAIETDGQRVASSAG